jgi:ADP-ribose pyrophosphatase
MGGIMIERGPWKVVQSRDVYRDPWIAVQVDDVIRPDGAPGIHSIIHLKPGVCVLALDDQQHVYLTEEFHYAVGRVTLEGVSGGVETGEEPLTAAQRELREELGITATQWTDLGTVDPFTANVLSPTRLFLAEHLSFVETAREGTELIRCVHIPLDEALRLLWSGEITHAPTCVLLLKLAVFRFRAMACERET